MSARTRHRIPERRSSALRRPCSRLRFRTRSSSCLPSRTGCAAQRRSKQGRRRREDRVAAHLVAHTVGRPRRTRAVNPQNVLAAAIEAGVPDERAARSSAPEQQNWLSESHVVPPHWMRPGVDMIAGTPPVHRRPSARQPRHQHLPAASRARDARSWVRSCPAMPVGPGRAGDARRPARAGRLPSEARSCRPRRSAVRPCRRARVTLPRSRDERPARQGERRTESKTRRLPDMNAPSASRRALAAAENVAMPSRRARIVTTAT
jgi:hypothetical protein